ncbi:MAG: LON peptidase substrate-binding domain-containing protein [Acidobacteriota bacterium]
MSDSLDKLAGMDRIPIFPLPLVLIPNELLPLHIFEPRYRQMLKDIELRRNMFGVTFFDTETAVMDRPEPGTTGCIAEIRESKTLPDGRSNIVTSGLVRYRLIEYVSSETPYLLGDVEFFEDEPDDTEALSDVNDEVFDLFDRVSRAAFKLSGGRGRPPEISKTDPESFSFLVTAAFNLDNQLKYKFLTMTSTTLRLSELKAILDQAVPKMEANADLTAAAQTNGHSSRPIDLD